MITSSEYRQLKRTIDGLKDMLEQQSLLTEQQAAEFLGVKIKTLQNRVYDGTLDGTYTVNKLGHRMYYRSKLVS